MGQNPVITIRNLPYSAADLGSSRSLTMSQEDAMTEVDLLQNLQITDHGGLMTYSGYHPDLGNVHIAVPPMGESILLLPFEAQRE